MKQNNNSKFKIVLGIILAIIILLCAIYVDFSNSNNNFEEKPNKIYSNLNIDKSKLNIFYLNVGQADSTLLTMGEDVMLIDAGNKSDGDNIVQFLKAQGIEEIDYLIETHSDDDHSGGIEKIVQNLDVCNVYMPQSAIEESEIKDDININVFSDLEQTYSLGNATWKVLSVNNSEYSKHPSENTLERLNSINSKIYRTDVNGTIWITSDGTAIEIEELDMNLNGKSKQAILLEDRKYSLIFYVKTLPFLSTTV